MKNITNTSKGMSLLELIIGLVIVSILALISMRLYTHQILKGRRLDAINALLSLSLAEERYRSNNTSYGTLAQIGGNTTSTEGFYTLSVSNISAGSYMLTATAIGNQANDSVDGTACSPLVLSMSNGTITKTPSACWPS